MVFGAELYGYRQYPFAFPPFDFSFQLLFIYLYIYIYIILIILNIWLGVYIEN